MIARLSFLALALSMAAGLPHMPRIERKVPMLPRIVGGVEATPGQFPYIISMQVESGFGRYHSCGGSIYNENYVITAGHCVHGQNAHKVFVIAGEHDLSVVSGDEQESQALDLIPHEDYSSATLYNDIALISLQTPLVMNSFVQPVVLPAQMELTSPGTMCTTSGWGTTSEGGSSPDILRTVDLPVVDDTTCREINGVDEVADSMICAGFPEGGKDTCQGDSGGPFVCEGKLHGLVSWGYGCARPDTPGVYTEVAYFRDWLDANAP
ncbi:hypothetical protein SK128_014832 [Halocaridina rubra]|uniref:Peptidase S1 domain-containing protein n=1 Tax=Halocaridina rubra TaxID=373956 RepID=A0AAN8X3H2_HALRR